MKKLFGFIVFAFLISGAACSVADRLDPSAPAPSGSASLDPLGYGEGTMVKLYYSKCYATYTFGTGKFIGYIEVENAAYRKEVVVHYTLGSEWKDIAASYLKSIPGNKEIWYFALDGIGFNPFAGWDVRFAVRYTVNGQTYWDNNNGQDYMTGTGPRNFSAEFAWGKSIVAMQYASYGQNDTEKFFNCRIFTKYAEGDKSVKIVYTEDNWATVKEAQAQYVYDDSDFTGGNKASVWWAYAPLAGTPENVSFAISYTLNGAAAWDNNFGRNYTVSPGTIWE
ncbi:MAG: hypothetical protein A2Y33_08845 [Spirochaetes bacterium GWF1_51_8]|nr:MAG: hypothetical protein A2Y33_08845 [Spirochaetes bacterium GWF1_51_8]